MKGPCRPNLPSLLLVALGAPASLSTAQDTMPPLRVLAEAFRDAARARLEGPTPQERVGEELAPEGRIARLLEDTRLDLRALEGGKDGDLALAVGIDLAKVVRAPATDSAPSFDFLVEGQLAFEQDRNPDDFVATTLRLRWSGARLLGPGARARAAVGGALEVPAFEELRALDAERFERLSARFDPAAPEALAVDPDFAFLSERYFESLAPRLADELAWAFDLHAALESNQDFSSRQVVAGAALAGRLITWNPDSRASRYDVFDLPAALVRWLAGEDERLRLTGQALPSVVAGLEVVDAARDEARGALTDDESFLRGRLELALASLLFHLDERPVELSARWRFFHEFDAPSAVTDAGTDDSSHLELRLGFARGWFLSYSAGELPLDPRYDSTVAFGYEFQF